MKRDRAGPKRRTMLEVRRRDGQRIVQRAEEGQRDAEQARSCMPAAAPETPWCRAPGLGASLVGRRPRTFLQERRKDDGRVGPAGSHLISGAATRPLLGGGLPRARNRPQSDLTPDGQRFLMIRENSASQAVYVENWFAEMEAKARQ